jgi:2-oxoglutarate ferredoxin oxidoreductase subunit alpha
MRCEILIGGKAGQGPNILTEVLSQELIKAGYFVFYSRDYESLIRGGHNFNMLSFSDKPIYSNSSKIDVLVSLDENTKKKHSTNLNKGAIVVEFVQGKGNMFYAGVLFKILGLDFKMLEEELKKLKKFEENIKDAKEGFDLEKRNLKLDKPVNKNKSLVLMNGSQATAISALKSGLDIYYAYPMTPATPLMMELGTMQLDKGATHKVVEVENEIAVALAGIGSSVVGKRVMVGTSGGGFDLMTEGMSFAAMAEVPIVFYLAQRPGPGTGVATYTSQGDLNMALHAGHGEFFRMVVAPGDNEECMKLTNDAFYFTHKYRVPSIILIDKHLGESKAMFDDKVNVKEIKSTVKTGERFNSYESDKKQDDIATEDAAVIKSNFDKRMANVRDIGNETKEFEMIKVYGNEKSKNLILSWGSTKGAILDALNEVDAKFVQVLYMSPFPAKQIADEIKKSKEIVVVENNSESPLGRLIAEKTGIILENKILKYDGRPFFVDELAEEFGRKLK